MAALWQAGYSNRSILSEADEMKQQVFIPEGMEELCATYHHAPAMRVGNLVWTSGQVGMSDNGQIPDTVTEQAELAFQNLQRVLECAGATMDDVVELQTFHVGLPNGSAEFRAVKDRYFPNTTPAWTGLGVSFVALPGVLLEVKAVAVINSGT
jgi:enamine deaminase RidA (YjgF/YER057c/UK114 family)